MSNEIIDEKSLLDAIKLSQSACEKFSHFTQADTDRIFAAAATAANKARILLAEIATEETGMGIFEDKVIKNNFAAEYIYNAYKDTKTVGIIETDESYGIKKIAEPVGVIAALIPTTNPTSTVIFKCLLAIKTRNAIIISPHPRAKRSTIEAAKIVRDAAVAAGMPKNAINWIDTPSSQLTSVLMKNSDLILATGGTQMVKAAYSSGKPAIGVGAGNTPAVIDESANIKLAVHSVIHSKTFDNGTVCASEQSVIVPKSIYTAVKEEFSENGCAFLSPEQATRLAETIMQNGSINPNIVGKSAREIAEAANIEVAQNTKILAAEVTDTNSSETFANEKLCPVLAFYKADDIADAFNKADKLIKNGGYGHTASIYIDEHKNKKTLAVFADIMKAGRILVNTPASFGAVGDLYNFKLPPSLTLGCGTWGGNSVSENVGIKHLLNIKTVAFRRENMLWFKTPPKIYFKKGCLPQAIKELKNLYNKHNAFIVTDEFLYKNGYTKLLENTLKELNIEYTVFFDIEPDPSLATVKKGADALISRNPDCIIAFGGGSAMDAAKIMWALYENPDMNFENIAMRFMDIRKRISPLPGMGKKAYFVAIPTSAGTGSEVTPFSVITDEKTNIKYPIADYELLPNMAIIDTDCFLSAPKSLTAAAGFDAITHALEAYVSVMRSDYTDALALHAIKIMFEFLPRAYADGKSDIVAREKTANAATMAGMSFANSFLGLCHSMAHKLGAAFSLAHGIANAIIIPHVIRYNATENPHKMGTFSQYGIPDALSRYAKIADALSLGGNTDREKTDNLIAALCDLKSQLGIKPSVKDYGISRQEFDAALEEMSLLAFDDQCTPANPRYPSVEDIKRIYTAAYYGTCDAF